MQTSTYQSMREAEHEGCVRVRSHREPLGIEAFHHIRADRADVDKARASTVALSSQSRTL